MSERNDAGSWAGQQPAEGVRIIRADEAKAALESGEAEGRRRNDQLRLGDVPPAPSGPRPAHRFPLPDSVDPSEAVSLPPLASSRAPDEPQGWDPPPPPPEPRFRPRVEVELDEEEEEGSDMMWDDDPAGSWEPAGSSDRTTEMMVPEPPGRRQPEGLRPPAREAPPRAEDGWSMPAAPRPPAAGVPDEGITVSGSADMPHWTDPPTGEVPRLRFDDDDDDDLEAWRNIGSRGVRWRGEQDWNEADELGDLGAEAEPMGALDQTRSEHSDLYSFDQDFERVTSRTGSQPVVDLSAGEPDDRFSETGVVERVGRPSSRRGASQVATGAGRSARRGTVRVPAGAGGAGAATVDPAEDLRLPRDSRARSGAERRRPASQRRGAAPDDRRGGGGQMGGRVGVGVVLVVVLLIAYAVGPKALLVLSLVVLVAAAAEAYNMTRQAGFRPATLLGLIGTAGCLLGAYWKGPQAIGVVAALFFGGAMLWYVLGVEETRPLANVAVTAMAFVWIGVLGSFAAVMLAQHDGKGEFLGAVVVAVAADIGAYVVGRAIGSRPLASRISPNKTVEGFIGGLVAALIVGAVIGKVVSPWAGMRHGLVLGLFIGLLAPVGDLFESMLKRDLGIKDSGNVLGGHGGVLDRFDGILVALPTAYFVVTLFGLR